MPEETSIADLIQSLGTTPQKLEEEFDVTRVVRWAFPVCGLVFAGMAGDIAYELKQKPPQPTQIQPAQEAYSRISYNRGSIDDVKILYEGVIAAKNATGDHLNLPNHKWWGFYGAGSSSFGMMGLHIFFRCF